MSTMPNMPARLTNPLGIILVVLLLLVIRVQAALRWRTLLALSALMPCPASPNRCACSNAQSSAEPANRAANSAIAKGVGWGSLKRGLMFQAALLMERADVCLTNGWLRSIAFQAAVVFFRLP